MTEGKETTVEIEQHEIVYDIQSLRRRYGFSRHEAERILERFGNSIPEIDLLLSGRGRTPKHRPKELATPEQKAPFGIG